MCESSAQMDGMYSFRKFICAMYVTCSPEDSDGFVDAFYELRGDEALLAHDENIS